MQILIKRFLSKNVMESSSTKLFSLHLVKFRNIQDIHHNIPTPLPVGVVRLPPTHDDSRQVRLSLSRNKIPAHGMLLQQLLPAQEAAVAVPSYIAGRAAAAAGPRRLRRKRKKRGGERANRIPGRDLR